MAFAVGQRVAITRFWEKRETLGEGTVAFVGKIKVVLTDGSEWRASDGYEWGRKPDKHFGRAGQKCLRPAEAK